ncbi:MAG: hypothetical protein GX287_06710 [Fusobacteria bacterium]|nr:hypothetical protein [Fusobacteriota bacterium]
MEVIKYILGEIKNSDLLFTITIVLLILVVIIILREGIMNFIYFLDKKKTLNSIDNRISKGLTDKRGTYASDKHDMQRFLVKSIVFLIISGMAIIYVLMNLSSLLKSLGF